MRYFFSITFIVCLIGCNANIKDEEVRNVIDYFNDTKPLVDNFKQLIIVPRGGNTFIYGIDSLQLGLYLVGFNSSNKSELKISYLPDSLLLARGINDKENFKSEILNLAFNNLSIMERLNIQSVNSCFRKENCCIQFVLENGIVITYLCSPIENEDQIKNEYGENIKIAGKYWLYSLNGEN
jgi:hypothetical protein